MNRFAMAVWMLTLTMMVGGCSIVGTWKAASITPEASKERFELATVTFDEDDSYSASCTVGGKPKTSTGTYKWDGCHLEVTPKDGATRTYTGALWCGRELHLCHKSTEYGEVKAVLKKQAEEAAAKKAEAPKTGKKAEAVPPKKEKKAETAPLKTEKKPEAAPPKAEKKTEKK